MKCPFCEEVLPKMTYYLLIDEYGSEKECYQASQLRKAKYRVINRVIEA